MAQMAHTETWVMADATPVLAGVFDKQKRLWPAFAAGRQDHDVCIFLGVRQMIKPVMLGSQGIIRYL